MKRSILTVLAIVSACTASTAAIAEEFEGGASIGGSYSNIQGQKAKFNEYRSLGDGAKGSLNLNYRANNGLNLEGLTDFTIVNGRSGDSHVTTDVNLDVKARLEDVFKASLFYNETPHNFTYGAKTYQTGVGTTTLTSAAGVKTAADFINPIDYAIKRYNYGAEAEINLKSPLFFLVRVERTDTSGLLPMTVRGNNNASMELPAPISYTSDTLFLQSGYRSQKLIATIDGTLANFNNDNTNFSSTHVTAAGASQTSNAYLAPNNQYYKIGGSVMYKLPLFASTLMARASHSYLDSNFTFLENAPAGRTGWNGKVQESTASIVLSSTPLKDFNTRLYYSYFGRENNSDQNFNYSSGTGNVKLFNYHKNTAGLEASYRLPAKTKVSAGYEYIVTDRTITTRTNADTAYSDSPETKDHTIYVQFKNDLLDWMSAKIKYQRTLRESNFDYRNTNVSAGIQSGGNSNNRYWFKPVGVADKIQDTIKAGVDLDLFESLAVGIEYAFAQNSYNHSVTGVQYDNRHNINLDATYTKGIAKLNAYSDIEFVKTSAYYFMPGHASYPWAGAAGGPGAFWSSKRRDVNYAIGTRGDFDIIKDKLAFGIGYRYERADGSNDLGVSNPATVFTNINYLDDYIKNSVDAKVSYKFTKNISVDLGYIYEHLKYTDDAYTNYNNVTGYGGSGGTGTFPYQTGAYANPNYDASVVYTKLNIKF